MIKKYLILLLTFGHLNFIFSQEINLYGKTWKFQTGDNTSWAKFDFDDSAWKTIDPLSEYETQGFADYDGYSWYRVKFFLPNAFKADVKLADNLRLILSQIDDVDEIFINGEKVGQTGSFPYEKSGFVSAKDIFRKYIIPANHNALRWEQDNVLSIKVFDKEKEGGLYGVDFRLSWAKLEDYITLNTNEKWNLSRQDTMTKQISIKSTYSKMLKISVQVTTIKEGKKFGQSSAIRLEPNQPYLYVCKASKSENTSIEISLTELKTFETMKIKEFSPPK